MTVGDAVGDVDGDAIKKAMKRGQNAYVIYFYLYGCVGQLKAVLKLRKFFLICTGPYTYGEPFQRDYGLFTADRHH